MVVLVAGGRRSPLLFRGSFSQFPRCCLEAALQPWRFLYFRRRGILTFCKSPLKLALASRDIPGIQQIDAPQNIKNQSTLLYGHRTRGYLRKFHILGNVHTRRGFWLRREPLMGKRGGGGVALTNHRYPPPIHFYPSRTELCDGARRANKSMLGQAPRRNSRLGAWALASTIQHPSLLP